MKRSAIAMAALAGTLGFGSLASAQVFVPYGHIPGAVYSGVPHGAYDPYAPPVYDGSAAGQAAAAQRGYGSAFDPYVIAAGRRMRAVPDWHLRGLYAPPPGYHWYQDNRNYALVQLGTNVIAQLLRR